MTRVRAWTKWRRVQHGAAELKSELNDHYFGCLFWPSSEFAVDLYHNTHFARARILLIKHSDVGYKVRKTKCEKSTLHNAIVATANKLK